MTPFMANNTYIYSEDSLLDYLNEMGLSKEDLAPLFNVEDEEISFLKEEIDSWERCCDSYRTDLYDLCNEIFAITSLMRQGKGGTKKYIASKIDNILRSYC